MAFTDSSLGGIVSGVGNFFSTLATNRANQKLAKQQNQWNIEQWNREANFTREMWNATNEYNDPSKQMQRLTEAGLSPWAAAEVMGAGDASGVSTPAGSPAVGYPNEKPDFTFIGEAAQRAFDNYLREKQANAEIRKTNAEADSAETAAAMNAAYFDQYWKQVQDENLAGLILENKGKSHDVALKMQSLEHNEGNYMLNSFLQRQQMRLNEQRVTYNELQNVAMRVDNEIKKLNLQWLPEQIRANLAAAAASTFASMQAGYLSQTQREHELFKKYQTILQTADVHNANEIANSLSKIKLGNAAMDFQWNEKYNNRNNQPNVLWYRLNDISKGIGHLLGNGVAPLLKFLK